MSHARVCVCRNLRNSNSIVFHSPVYNRFELHFDLETDGIVTTERSRARFTLSMGPAIKLQMAKRSVSSGTEITDGGGDARASTLGSTICAAVQTRFAPRKYYLVIRF